MTSITIERTSFESDRETIHGDYIDDKSTDTVTIAASEDIDDKDEKLSDGGYGWLVVLGGFLFLSSTVSIEFSWGVMQDYYYRNVFNKTQSQLVELSFVGTMITGIANFVCPLIQIAVSRFGFRAVMLTGSILVVVGLELAGQATEIWHLYLTQGLLFGIGVSCLYTNTFAIAPHWFTKRRGFAMGLMGSGGAAGGLIIPFIMSFLNQKLGPSWTYRILGFICLACTLFNCVIIKERITYNPGKKKLSQIIQLSVLKNKNYLFFVIAANIGLLGTYIPFFYLPTYASTYGLSHSQGSSLIAIASAGSFFGRVMAGWLGDRIGYFNSFIIFNIIASISNFFIWTFAKSYGSLLLYAIVFGFSSNTYYSIMAPIIASILPLDQFYSGLTLALMTNCIPLFGTNISTVIQEKVNTSPFFTHIMFTGSSYLLGAILLFILKLRLNKHVFSKV